MIYRGFTTIRSIGNSTYEARGSLAAKEMIDLGLFPGARMVVTPHYMASLGSHGKEILVLHKGGTYFSKQDRDKQYRDFAYASQYIDYVHERQSFLGL